MHNTRSDPTAPEEIHMILHQDIAVEGNDVPEVIAFEAFQINGVLGVIMKNGRPLIAADDDMTQDTRKIETRLPSHAGKSTFRKHIWSIVKPEHPAGNCKRVF
jgi:hypothetical protein